MQSSFLIFVRNGHSSWSPRAAGRKAVAVTNGGALAAAATARPARAVMRRSIYKIIQWSRVPAPRSRRGDSCGSVWSLASLSPCRDDAYGYDAKTASKMPASQNPC